MRAEGNQGHTTMHQTPTGLNSAPSEPQSADIGCHVLPKVAKTA
jgi:hypothetical protein